MKILITGATGFLGSHLTKALIKEGHNVTILKRSFSDTWRIASIEKKLTIFNIDECSVEQPFKECGPYDVIIHTATEYDRNVKAFSRLLRSNIYFPLALLETAILYKTNLFINTDSFIHKNNQGYQHLAGYSLTKKQFLQWLKVYSAFKKIRIINLKLEHVYGPYDSENKFFPYIYRSCINNKPEINLTLGNQKRDFIYVNDVINAYSLLMKQELKQFDWFNEYEVGTGNSVTVREFVELIHKKTNSKTSLHFGGLPQHKNEIMDSKANNVAIKKLGWEQKYSLEKGIKATMEAERFKKNYE
ncbi:epimerase [Anaerobacillus arseniciselenatis]|uniref:Epimerase n=1 Tax=Anaerobacillus arseniciselenatis TaxID=85682 RepID=A0A1S2LE30_9BACI|nr:NAD(P)-dependent oxidoreductase [Anaerobacillus arseniciselenatis]OIJ10769.1 epimerase [Anaerobacillus arseniciselenatis]